MEIATETERKYDVAADFELPPLTGAADVNRLDDPVTHDLDATYFDTAGFVLARHRYTLRRRRGGSDAGWHLKTPGEGSSRTEHRLPLGDDNNDVPAELLAQVRAIVRQRPLLPVARLRTTRVETALRGDDGRTLALVEQDEVRADSDGAEQTWREIEVELVDGGTDVLNAVEKRLVAAGATPARGPSKLARALGERLTAVSDSPTGRGAASSGGAVSSGAAIAESDPVLAYARAQRDAIVANDPQVRRGEAEAIHRMRVATRRLRSTLRTFRNHWPSADDSTALRAELKWLADLLGAVRDAQVLAGRLSAAAHREGSQFAEVGTRIHEHLGVKEQAGHRALSEALDGGRYLTLLDGLDALVDTPGRKVGNRHTLRQARKALEKAETLLDEATRPPNDPIRAGGSGIGVTGDDEHLHDARKAYKRARYAIEVFAPRVSAAKRLVKQLTTLQDVLGSHQDSVVAREVLRELAGSAHADAANGFPYGVLHARQQYAGAAVLEQLPAVARQTRRRKLRSWL